MTALTVAIAVVATTFVALPIYSLGVRRLLGLRLGLLRTLIAGTIALLVVSPIISELSGSTYAGQGVLPGLWFVILGVAIALLVGIISAALESGRLSVNMRVFADDRDRQYVTGLVHRVLLAFLAAVSAVVAVMMLGLHGGPNVTDGISLYQFFGYSLLVTGAALALRVLVVAVRPSTS
jgi:hypothetical protein